MSGVAWQADLQWQKLFTLRTKRTIGFVLLIGDKF